MKGRRRLDLGRARRGASPENRDARRVALGCIRAHILSQSLLGYVSFLEAFLGYVSFLKAAIYIYISDTLKGESFARARAVARLARPLDKRRLYFSKSAMKCFKTLCEPFGSPPPFAACDSKKKRTLSKIRKDTKRYVRDRSWADWGSRPQKCRVLLASSQRCASHWRKIRILMFGKKNRFSMFEKGDRAPGRARRRSAPLRQMARVSRHGKKV